MNTIPHFLDPLFLLGKVMKLSPKAEEVATFFAKMLDHEYTTKEVFRKNFFKDWRKVLWLMVNILAPCRTIDKLSTKQFYQKKIVQNLNFKILFFSTHLLCYIEVLSTKNASISFLPAVMWLCRREFIRLGQTENLSQARESLSLQGCPPVSAVAKRDVNVLSQSRLIFAYLLSAPRTTYRVSS